jgi:AcrR family transcriptional regulator
MQVVPIRSTKIIAQGKRAQIKAQNRRIILDGARKVFGELGYGATKVRDVIRATPLAAGTFYNYFRSKEEVFQALCEEAAQAVGPAMRDARQKAKSAEAFFLGTFSGFFALVAERRASGIAPDLLRSQPGTLGLNELKDDIEVAIGRGILPAVNPQILASTIWGLAWGIAETLPEWCGLEGAAQSATAFMLNGFSTLAGETNPLAVNFA